MGWCFRKSIGMPGGFRLNFSKHGIGASMGITGFRLAAGHRGVRTQVTIPGTGIYHRTDRNWHSLSKENKKRIEAPVSNTNDKEKVSSSVLTSKSPKESFESALNYLKTGKLTQALDHINGEQIYKDADAYFLIGVIFLRKNEVEEAENAFSNAYSKRHVLGRTFDSVCPAFAIRLPITEYTTLLIKPDVVGVTLIYAECLQASAKYESAITVVKEVLSEYPDNPGLILSLIELLYESNDYRQVADIDTEKCSSSPLYQDIMGWKQKSYKKMTGNK